MRAPITKETREAKNKKQRDRYPSKKNKYDTKMGAITYLIKHSVYKNEWTGMGMYEAIVKIAEAPQKFRFSKDYLNSLLKEAENS